MERSYCQGEKIERIEESIENTTTVTGNANDQLKQARKMKKRVGKMKRILIIGGVVVVVILVIVLAVVLS
jgi:t-SNARE complex subunit (syntaxin)